MTKREIYRMWRNQMQEGKYDYWTAQLDWAIFTDQLCKDGVIPGEQWNRLTFPHKYGAHVRITHAD